MLMLLFVAAAGILICEKKPARQKDILFLILTGAAMIALASLRGPNVGGDYKMYADYFQLVASNDFSFLFSDANPYRIEYGFGLLNFLVSRVSTDTRVFVAAAALITIATRLWAVYRMSANVWLSAYIFVSFGFLGYAMCTLRQELAICVLFFAIPFLQKRRPVPYFLLILLAGSFHKSVLLLLPVYFFANLPLSRVTLSLYTAATLFILMFSWPIIGFVTRYVYKFYAPGSPGDYYLQGRSYNTAFFPLVLFLMAALLQKLLVRRKPENIVLINFSCYSAMLFVLTIKHFIFQRIALIFLPAAALLLIPEMVMLLDDEKKRALTAVEEARTAAAPKGQREQKQRTEKQRYAELSTMYWGPWARFCFPGLCISSFCCMPTACHSCRTQRFSQNKPYAVFEKREGP
jgi:hypothetical protein